MKEYPEEVKSLIDGIQRVIENAEDTASGKYQYCKGGNSYPVNVPPEFQSFLEFLGEIKFPTDEHLKLAGKYTEKFFYIVDLQINSDEASESTINLFVEYLELAETLVTGLRIDPLLVDEKSLKSINEHLVTFSERAICSSLQRDYLRPKLFMYGYQDSEEFIGFIRWFVGYASLLRRLRKANKIAFLDPKLARKSMKQLRKWEADMPSILEKGQ